MQSPSRFMTQQRLWPVSGLIVVGVSNVLSVLPDESDDIGVMKFAGL